MRKARLSAQAVAAAALRQIDEVGVEALSMRGVGKEVGASAMALYRYFDGKDALLDAVQDAILADMGPIRRGPDWQTTIRSMALSLRSTLRAHPRAIPLFSRPAATDGAFARLVEAVDVLEDAGFSPQDALNAFQVTLAFIVGHALWQFTPQGERPANDEFEFGLQALLTGFEAKLDR